MDDKIFTTVSRDYIKIIEITRKFQSILWCVALHAKAIVVGIYKQYVANGYTLKNE